MSDDTVLTRGAVVNASPLLTLSKAKLEYVLPRLFAKIIVPGAVWQEITAYQDLAWKKLLEAPWLTKVTVPVDGSILLWNLGMGESEVLSWALATPGCIAVVDDLAARRCSTALSIRHVGTAGLLILASRFKLIPSLEEAFHEVRKAGLYLKDDLVQRLLAHESS